MNTILIKAGHLFDGVADRVTPRAYVIIEGDVITAVGPQSDLDGDVDRFTQQIDLGSDVTLLPGLINMHTHMSFSAGESVFDDHQRESYETKLIRAVGNLRAALHTGVTTLRDCGTLNGIAFAMRAAIEQGLATGMRDDDRVPRRRNGIGHCAHVGVGQVDQHACFIHFCNEFVPENGQS